MAKSLIIVICLFILVGCAAPVDIVETTSRPDGFFHGFWHGIILFFSFIGSLFNENIAIYNPKNNGGLYDLGFFLGVVVVFGGSSSTVSKN